MSDKLNKDPELRWIRHCPPPDGGESLALWWNGLPPDARREVLDESGVLDIAAATYKDLADGFEIMVPLMWHNIPRPMRDYLLEKVRVGFINEEEDTHGNLL